MMLASCYHTLVCSVLSPVFLCTWVFQITCRSLLCKLQPSQEEKREQLLYARGIVNFVPSVGMAGGYYSSVATNTAQKGSWGGGGYCSRAATK